MAGTIALTDVYGPAQGFNASVGGVRPASVPWDAFGAAVKDTAAYLETYGRIPDEVWIGSQNLSPADYLATLADVTEDASRQAAPSRRTSQYDKGTSLPTATSPTTHRTSGAG